MGQLAKKPSSEPMMMWFYDTCIFSRTEISDQISSFFFHCYEYIAASYMLLFLDFLFLFKFWFCWLFITIFIVIFTVFIQIFFLV